LKPARARAHASHARAAALYPRSYNLVLLDSEGIDAYDQTGAQAHEATRTKRTR
jgi:hypothetical protein